MPIEAKFESRIPDYAVRLDLTVHAAVLAGAQEMAQIARDNVRKDTGSLMETIDVEDFGQEVTVNAGNISGGYKGGSFMNERPPGSPVDYAIDQEYGLTGTPSTPYMTPAAEFGWPRMQERIADAIGRMQ